MARWDRSVHMKRDQVASNGGLVLRSRAVQNLMWPEKTCKINHPELTQAQELGQAVIT